MESLADRREVNLNTLRRFGRLWVRNLLANLPLFLRAAGTRELEGLFAGMPALLLAAGPSLEPVLAVLPALAERLVLVAVDTSYRLCRQAGVKPDLLVTVDPQYWNSRHLDWAELEGILLASEPSVHPRTFHRPRLPNLYFMSSFSPSARPWSASPSRAAGWARAVRWPPAPGTWPASPARGRCTWPAWTWATRAGAPTPAGPSSRSAPTPSPGACCRRSTRTSWS